MTQVDFYILKETHKEPFICRLVEKIYHRGHQIYIHCDDQNSADKIDKLLWSFHPGSFIPHSQLESSDAIEQINIGISENPQQHADVLINMGKDVPLFFSRFDRVSEIIPGNDVEKNQGRIRYGFYRDRGYDLKTHQL